MGAAVYSLLCSFVVCSSVMRLLSLLAVLVLYGSAHAGPMTVTLNENQRFYRNTGIITLTDPTSGELLGKYAFATGGYGNGSAPFGVYMIGDFQGTDYDPLHIGPRWLIRNPGLGQGEAIDPGLPGHTRARVRTELEIHAAVATSGTLGCIAILGGPAVYSKFLEHLKYILSKSEVTFTLEANPNGKDNVEGVVAYYPHIKKRLFPAVPCSHNHKNYKNKDQRHPKVDKHHIKHHH